MEVEEPEQPMEVDGAEDNNDGSQAMTAKEKLAKSKENCREEKGKDSRLIVGNGRCDSSSCDSDKQCVKTNSDHGDTELKLASRRTTESKRERVVNGDIADHSSQSNSSAQDDDAEHDDDDDDGQDQDVNSASSSRDTSSTSEDKCATAKNTLQDNSGIISDNESETSPKDTPENDTSTLKGGKSDTEGDNDTCTEVSKSNAASEDVDIEESKSHDSKSKNTDCELEGKKIESENFDNKSEKLNSEINDSDDLEHSSDLDSTEASESKRKNTEAENEVNKSDKVQEKTEGDETIIETDKTNQNGDSPASCKSDKRTDDGAESSIIEDVSEENKNDTKPESPEQIEIDDDDVTDDHSKLNTMSNNKKIVEKIQTSKNTVGSLLKKGLKHSSESSLVGDPPFINVTYSARGPVPAVSVIGNSLLNTSSALRMVRPQYQNQFQFYLQGPPGYPVTAANSNQYIGVLNSQQAGVQNQARQINNKPPEKVEPPRPPQSSMDMIELSRWEVKQGLHRRARNTKIRPESELSHIARFLRDFGQDLVKEAVYNDLVKIQHKRNAEGKLKAKEAEDFKKLKSVHHELREKVGPCKVHFTEKCSCGFKTESINVIYAHKQHPHVDMYDMCCAYCSFDTRNPHAFRFHLEGEHNVKAIIDMKPPLWECSLCPYEHNIKNKLTQHKFKCTKNFKLHLNLHPAWMPGPETNFCLENMMYKLPSVKVPGPQVFNRQFIRPPPKQPLLGGQRLPPPRVSDTIQRMNAARLQGQQQMMKFAGQRPGIAPNVNLFQHRPGQVGQGNMQRAALQAVSAANRSGIHTNRMSAPTMPSILQKSNSAARSQMPKVSMIPPKPSLATNANVSSKINHLITLNDQVLDLAAKGQASSGFEICEICGGYVKDRTALRIHFFYAHRIDMPYAVFDRIHPPLYCATCFSRFWTAQGLQKHLDVHKEDSSGGVAGKCVVCGHRVPNILMHMRIVHNKALNNFLKECKCIFCGTSFQNKSIVENHMAAIHGVVVKSGAPVESSPVSSSRKPEKSGQPSHKSGTALVKGSVCVLCNLNFGRNVDLTRHCMKVHHTCMKCGMVVADKLSLMKHACLESPAGLRNCELCGEKGFHPAYHVKHIRDKHLKKCSVKIGRMSGYKNGSVNVKSVSHTSGKPISDEVIDVDERPTPIKKYKQATNRVLPISDDESESDHSSKKRKLDETDGKFDDDSNKLDTDKSNTTETTVKKARTKEPDQSVSSAESPQQSEDKDENTNCNTDTSNKSKPGERSSEGEASPGGSKERTKTKDIDTSDDSKNLETTSSNKTDANSEHKDDKEEEKNVDGPKVSQKKPDDRVRSEEKSETKVNSPETKRQCETSRAESAASDSSSDAGDGDGDGGAFCGFQSLSKPDKENSAEALSGNSDSDSD